MCEISDAVAVAVQEKTANKEVFSAFDITKAVRADKQGHFASHDKMKSCVHRMFGQGHMPVEYDKTLIGLDTGGSGDIQAFVYHPDTASAYDHPLAKKQTVQVTIPDTGNDSIPAPQFDDTDSTDDADDSDDADDGTTITVKTTVENRIEIPKNILAQMAIRQDGKGKYAIRASNGQLRFRSPRDGRVRVGCHYFGGTDYYNVEVDIVANEIKISPA